MVEFLHCSPLSCPLSGSGRFLKCCGSQDAAREAVIPKETIGGTNIFGFCPIRRKSQIPPCASLKYEFTLALHWTQGKNRRTGKSVTYFSEKHTVWPIRLVYNCEWQVGARGHQTSYYMKGNRHLHLFLVSWVYGLFISDIILLAWKMFDR